MGDELQGERGENVADPDRRSDGTFKPGHSRRFGSPAGPDPREAGRRGITVDLLGIADKKLREPLTKKSKRTHAEAVIDALIKEAKKGNIRAIERLIEEAHGKIADRLIADVRHGALDDFSDDELEEIRSGKLPGEEEDEEQDS